MGTRAVRQGPTSERVAANVKRLRDEQRLTLDQLSKRLGEVGRPILASGLSKIEQGDRRVDVDDLVALALALEVTPNALLMPGHADETQTALTEEVVVSARRSWRWAAGEALDTFKNDRGTYDLARVVRWAELTSPYKSDDERMAEVKVFFQTIRAMKRKTAGRDTNV